jgi:6-phosphogluconate dehydrogenase
MGTTTAIKTAEFGVIGLGVMGQNLALNIEDHGQSVAVWNLEPEWVDCFVGEHGTRQITGTKTLHDFVHSLAKPSASLPQNLTQAQRDYFGAHAYQRADDPSGGFVHTDWQALIANKSGGKQ